MSALSLNQYLEDRELTESEVQDLIDSVDDTSPTPRQAITRVLTGVPIFFALYAMCCFVASFFPNSSIPGVPMSFFNPWHAFVGAGISILAVAISGFLLHFIYCLGKAAHVVVGK